MAPEISICCFKQKDCHKIGKNALRHSFFMISIFYVFFISSMAQSTTISGAFEVSDAIASIGTVNTNSINNAIYNQDGLTIWQVTPNANYTYINDLKFYAKLDKNSGRLSILLSSEEENASLRGMIPSLYGDENYSLSITPDEFHKCYEYTNSKTLIYAILEDTFDELKAKSVISKAATLGKNPSYECSFSDKLYILGYHIAAAEYDNSINCFHNWPWGSGTDTCKYHPEFHGCEYSEGWANVDLNLDIKTIRNYYIYGGVYNDNGEESRISLDSTLWLQQINWGGKGDIKSGKNNISSKITLYGRKTWSVISAIIWMAIDADSVSAAGHITGEGSSKIDSGENLDVLETIALKKGPIEWPTVPASRNPPLLSNAKVTPECGKENDQYTFSVIYKDEDGTEPTTANIWIKGFDFDSPRSVYDSGYYNDMKKMSGDITQGATYSYSTQLPAKGEYHYVIYFVNNKGSRVDLPLHGFSDNLGLSGPYVGKECDSTLTITKTPTEQTTTTTTTGSGDVTVSDLGTTSDLKYEILATDQNGRTFSNADVYIDDKYIDKTDSEGLFTSDIPLSIGAHTITVIYDPLPESMGGNAPEGIGNMPDIDRLWGVGDIGYPISFTENIFAGAGRVEATGWPQKFTVYLSVRHWTTWKSAASGFYDLVTLRAPYAEIVNPLDAFTSPSHHTTTGRAA